MEKRLNWKDNLVKAAGIPEDLAYGQPVVTVTGHRRAVIQNYRGILLYTSEKLVLRTSHGTVTVCGKVFRSYPIVEMKWRSQDGSVISTWDNRLAMRKVQL